MCLSADKIDYLRERAESTTQGQLEDILAYVLRFKEKIRKSTMKEDWLEKENNLDLQEKIAP